MVLLATPIGKAVWLTFLLGFALHVLKRADASSRSRISGVRSIGHFLGLNWAVILIRLAIGVGLFEMLWNNPKFFGDQLGASWIEKLPFGWGFALTIGYCQDSLVDWLCSKVPALQKEVPKFKADEAAPAADVAAGSG